MFGFRQNIRGYFRAAKRPRSLKRQSKFERLEERFALAVAIVSDPAEPGQWADGSSRLASLSDDGRYVAFISEATNLVAGDTNGVVDVFVKDLLTGSIVRANTSSTGEQANNTSVDPTLGGPVLSAQGRLVVFTSQATNLLPGENLPGIFVKDLDTGIIQRVNQDASGIPIALEAFNPTISADGRYVAFSDGQVYVKDLQTGTLTHASTITIAPYQSAVGGWSPQLSADGKYVAFYTDAAILSGDTNNQYDIYIKDLTTNTYQLVRADFNFGSNYPGNVLRFSFSDDGRYIAFDSDANGLVLGDTDDTWDSFVTEVATGVTTRINTNTLGQVSDAAARFPVVSGDGRYVAFQSAAMNLINDPTQSSYQRIYIKDLQTGELRIAAETPFYNPDTTLLTTLESFAAISSNGRYVAFQSTSNAHVQDDPNGYEDIFLADLQPVVNTPPTVVASPEPVVTVVGGPASTTALLPLFTDAEDGAAGLTYSVPNNSSTAIVTVDQTSKELRLNFDYATPGIGSITIRAMDSQGLTVDTTLQVTIYAASGPRITFVEFSMTVLEGALLSYLGGALYNYYSGALPTTNVTTDRPELFSVQPTIAYNPSNVPSLAFQPAANAFGVATVTLTQQYDTTPQVFTITIDPVNDTPSFQAGGNVFVQEDSGAYHQPWANAINAGPENESSQQLTWDLTVAHPELFSVQPTIDREGKLDFTPASNAHGTTQVTVLLKDNGGTMHGGSDSVYESFMITIQPVAELGPTITEIQYFAGTEPVSNTVLTPITSIIVMFDRVMTSDGPGGVRNVANWGLTKDGKSIADQIGSLVIVSEAGQTTHLQINLKEPLGSGEYVLVAEPAITDHRELHLGQTAEVTSGVAKSFQFSVTLVVDTDDDGDPARGVIETVPEGNGNPIVTTIFTPILFPPAIASAAFELPNPLNRIQAANTPPTPLPLPQIPIIISFGNGVIGASHLAATQEQPEIVITGLGTTFITSTLPELTLDEEGDEFLTREEAKNRMLVILQPVPAQSAQTTVPQQSGVFPWWWVGLGMSSFLGGIGYYTVQRRLVSRTKRIPLT